jgi:hypothetical protein
MLTVTTFHKVVLNPPQAIIAPRTSQSGARPMATACAEPMHVARTSRGTGPWRRARAGFTRPPMTLPIADDASSSPYPRTDTCSVWVANNTNAPAPSRLQKPLTASMTTTIRSSRCPLSQRSPAVTPRANPGWRPCLSAPGRDRGNPVSSAADPANDATSTANGATGASANSALPTGGPTNEPPITCTTYWVPFALGSRSVGTSDGRTDWAALSKTTCALPRQRPAATSVQMLTWWTATKTATAATAAPWTS